MGFYVCSIPRGPSNRIVDTLGARISRLFRVALFSGLVEGLLMVMI